MKLKKTRIYLVSNCYNDPNKVYVGKEKSHQQSSRKKSHKKTFGNNIIFTYIDECDGWDIKNWGWLENFWIEQFRQWEFKMQNKKGNSGGPECLSRETKLKISQAKKGHKCYKNPKRGEKISKSRKGCVGWNLGKNFNKEHRNKLSKSKKGNKFNNKKIKQFDENLNFINEFPSIKDAALYMNYKTNTFQSSLAINKKYPSRMKGNYVKCKNFYWLY